MPREAHYNSAERNIVKAAADPYFRPAFAVHDRGRRAAWNLCWAMLYRPSPRPFHVWRAFLLRRFGATLGTGCRFYPASKIWAPWNLLCADAVTVADGAELYNPAPMRFGSHAIVSQGAFLCGATHDYDDPRFALLAYSTDIGAYAWVCARAIVAPGVNVSDGAVLGMGSVATRDMEPWSVYAGTPAVKIRERKRSLTHSP